MKIEQFVMAYGVEQDRLRAFLPEGFTSLRPVLRINAEVHNLHPPLCGIFCLYSVAVAHYGALIQTKSPTKCEINLAESLFQTRSSVFRRKRA